MKLKLISDFTDYYDHWFDTNGIPFYRMADDKSYDRRTAFRILEELGLRVPRYGSINLTSWEAKELVIYTNEYCHIGEGKLKVQTAHIPPALQYSFASEYILGYRGVSYRLLYIGNKTFWLKYISHNDWRSNCGDCAVVWHTEATPTIPRRLPLPLYAIDFVIDLSGTFYAIDLNLAPGLSYTPVQDYFTGKGIVSMLYEFYN
jgi:hypothetical protein